MAWEFQIVDLTKMWMHWNSRKVFFPLPKLFVCEGFKKSNKSFSVELLSKQVCLKQLIVERQL